MKRIILLFIVATCTIAGYGRGLRHSVCQVEPEYTSQERSEASQLALYLSRMGTNNTIYKALQASTHSGYFGSGVVVRRNGLCLLTTTSSIGYAKLATVTLYLHDKTLRFRSCPVQGIDTITGLTLIILPESEDLEPLAISPTPIDEGDDISSAGFVSLGSQPTWQLERGFISNAQLRHDSTTYIQHSAPVNIGSHGGPLLKKGENGYEIVGINIGSISSRDELAIATPTSAIQHTLTSDSLITGAQWQQLLRDRIEARTYEGKKKAEDKKRMNKRKTSRGITDDVPRVRQNFFYHNYLSSKNMEAGFGMEFALDKRRISFIGMQFAASWTEARPVDKYPTYNYSLKRYEYILFDPKGVFSPLFGLYLGAQVPLRLTPKHVLVPRFSQGGNLGPCVNQNYELERKYTVGTLMVTSDSRFGLEYHYQLEKIDLIFALEYTAHIYATGAEVCWRYKNNAKPQDPIDKHTQLIHINEKQQHIRYTCLNHGLGVRFAIGFGH